VVYRDPKTSTRFTPRNPGKTPGPPPVDNLWITQDSPPVDNLWITQGPVDNSRPPVDNSRPPVDNLWITCGCVDNLWITCGWPVDNLWITLERPPGGGTDLCYS